MLFMKKYSALFLLCTLTFTACKKEGGKAQSNDEKYESKLPNYGSVNLKEVFSPEDSKLADRNATVQAIDAYYKHVWEKGDLSGGVLVAKGDDILYEKYRGFAREHNTVPITKDVALHVASVSKPITAMAVMKLIEAGKLKINEPLTTLFPGFPYPEITVEMLLKQRSGLPKYEHFLEDAKVPRANYISNKFILDFIIKNKPELARKPDTGFMYCNTNFALLALVVEKITETPFPEAMQEIVFKPLKMNNTYIFQEKDIPTAGQSFYNNGKRLFPLDYLDLIYGDKNVYTTPRDLYNFSKALFSKDFLKPELMNLVFQPYSNEKAGVNNYGIGFRMKIFDNGEKLTYHNGWWHGSNAVFGHLLKSKVTIIAIGNKYSSRVYSTLALSGLFEDFPFERERLSKELDRLPVDEKPSDAGE
ncbi:Penicillin-binding protein 4* [Elizabethkingia miricola]|nr:Penicillin-binding protein 4* [Elizabethkingia miricola]